MNKGLIGICLGLVSFITTQELLEALIKGTDSSSMILLQVLPLAIAIGLVIGAFTTFLKSEGNP
jgi:hypothetical protein